MGRGKKPKREAAQVDPEDLPLGTRKPRSKLKRGDRGNEEAESAHAEGGKGVSEVNPAAMPSVVAEAESNFEGGVGEQRAEAAAAEGGSGDRAAAGIAAEDQPVGLEVLDSGAGARLEVASAPTEVGGGAAADVSGVNPENPPTKNPPAVSELSALDAVTGATQKAHDPELGKKEDKAEAEGTGEGVTKEPPEVQVEGLQGRSSLEGVESSAVDIEKKRSEVSAAQERKSGEVSAEMREEVGGGAEQDKAPPKETPPIAKPPEKGGAKKAGTSGKGDAAGKSEAADGGEKEAPTGAVGSGDFFGPSGKINPERMEYIRKLAQEFKEGKGGEEAKGLNAEEFRKLTDLVSVHQVARRMTSLMEATAAYPKDWDGRGKLHFDIPMCMLQNGNDAEKFGVVHPEVDANGRPKAVRITERMTTPAQVRTGERIWVEGHIKERGDVTAVIRPFGKDVLITEEDKAAMSVEDRADLEKFEKTVGQMCKSEDAGVKAKGEWLKANVVGRWLFLVDGNSRLEGYKRGRAKDKADTGKTTKDIFFQTFLVGLTADNMDDVAAMSRQINDNNIEFNSKKTVAQEVYACYQLNDKTEEEMEKIVSGAMLTLYGEHTGKWTKLRAELKEQGVNYPGIVFAVGLKPSLGLLLMDKSTLSLPAEKVGELGSARSVWALKRVHCANLSKEKRGFWEPIWQRWVMLEQPELVVPDIDVLDVLSMKHLPVSWDAVVVLLCELDGESFKHITGLDRSRSNLKSWVKWMGVLFAVCEAVVTQLMDFGFYEKPKTRKRGDSPALAKDYLHFAGAYDPYEFGKAILWMQTPDGPAGRPFWWAASVSAFSGNIKPAALASLRDRMTLSYFRTVLPSRTFEVTPDQLQTLVALQNLPKLVIQQFVVIPVPELRHALITRAGFVKPAGTMFKNEDRDYVADEQVMEAVMGCRWEVDCDEATPTIRVWDRGAEPRTLAKKEKLPAAPYLSASVVESIVNPPRSLELWDRKIVLQIRPDSRLAVMAVRTDTAHQGVVGEKFPPISAITDRLGWVTSSSQEFDLTERPVHLVMYLAACAREVVGDARALESSVRAATQLMSDLLRFDGTVGIAVLPGDTPLDWIAPGLQIVARRVICLVPKKLEGFGKFEKWGDSGTMYQVVYLTPVGSELELPDQSKQYGFGLTHKKFKHAGTFTTSPCTADPESWPLETINSILEGAVPSATGSAVAVVLGEENGYTTAALLRRNMLVVSVLSRRLHVWMGSKGRRIRSTPTDMTFAERAMAYRAGQKLPDEFDPLPAAPAETTTAPSSKTAGTATSRKGKEKVASTGEKQVTEKKTGPSAAGKGGKSGKVAGGKKGAAGAASGSGKKDAASGAAAAAKKEPAKRKGPVAAEKEGEKAEGSEPKEKKQRKRKEKGGTAEGTAEGGGEGPAEDTKTKGRKRKSEGEGGGEKKERKKRNKGGEKGGEGPAEGGEGGQSAVSDEATESSQRAPLSGSIMSSPARSIAEPPVTLSESSDSEDSDDIVVRSSEGTVDLRNYKRFAISGDNMNCFFMTAFVVATLNGEPLGGGEELAAQLRAGRLPIDLEKEGLKVRATIVAYLRDHKNRPIPPQLITSSRPPSKRRPLPTWEKLYQALRDEDDLTEFDTYVDRMSRSGCWGGDFEQRVVWAMGHKVTVAKGENRRKMRIYQPQMEFVQLRENEAVWYHVRSVITMC
ncbi:hypothetical protein KFL_000010040 [Klebsormidium nitens]|uniref:Uncharacterized protein n=1 Tax=Klebsormidium nitens TaxID=105231 RepID=A0A0U9HQ80_KLENI|nr:hypothetical protein KFL_000010040 [Klebsormidium nitens]|eukprot:GAQ77555.1 hypothetical protein KFL_000010040 [Klebsormidium nitens]